MKLTFKLILILIFLSNCLIAQEDYSKKMSIQEVKEDFKIFKTTIQSVHPNLYLYTPKLKADSTLASIEELIKQQMSPLELFRTLTPFVHSIRNAHTSIRPPQAYIDYVKSDAKTLPLKLMMRSDSLIVINNFSTNKDIKPGTVIKKINGSPVKSLMDSLAKFTFLDGYNENYSNYLSSQYLNTRYAYGVGLPEVYEIEYVDSVGNLGQGFIEPLAWSKLPAQKKTKDKQQKYYFLITDNTAILDIKSFSIDVKAFRKFLKKSFAQIREKDIDNIIIDLRDNRGGSQEATNELLSYFIKETIFPIKEKFAKVDKLPNQEFFKKDNSFKYFHKEKLKKSNGKYLGVSDAKIKVNPKRKPFLGNSIFLINENCASATTSFLGQIRTHQTDAIFIGRETLGNPAIVVADYIVTLVLPHSKIEVKIPLISSEKNVSFENPKGGVLPDIKVELTMDKIHSKVDTIMEKAIERIKKNE